MSVEVSVDQELCMGSGDCVRTAPLAFRLDDDETVSEPTAAAGSSDPDLLLEAARNCPTQAIRLVRAGVVLYGVNQGQQAPERSIDG